MKGIILLANHFEDVEAICTIDMLRRAKIEIDLVSITGQKELITQSGIGLNAEKLINEVDLNEYCFVILPGGKAIFETHRDSNITKSVIKHFYDRKLLISAICAAPIVIKDYLKNQEFTCFPSCEDEIEGIYKKSKVEVHDNIITSKAAGTTFEFAYEIIKYLKGEEIAQKTLDSVYY